MHAVSLTPHARCMRCHWYRMHGACGVIDTACTVHAVSLTPHAHVYAESLIPHAWCMRYPWHRMHKKLRKLKIIRKTAMVCKKIKNACSVNDTASTVHVCLRCHWHRMHGACGINDIACKIWHRLHFRRTIRNAVTVFKGNIYQNIYVPELSYPMG
jgi:hypothetical protein